jgi:hypothetical protein
MSNGSAMFKLAATLLVVHFHIAATRSLSASETVTTSRVTFHDIPSLVVKPSK